MQLAPLSTSTPRFGPLGSSAFLLDAAGAAFDIGVQRKIWAVARLALNLVGVLETVPGMNNLMVVFDPLRITGATIQDAAASLWDEVEPETVVGKTVELPVVYGGTDGEDLADLARHAGLGIEDVVRRHAAASYTVAAIGAMPGFPYLAGLDPALAWSRRASPRARVNEGSVIIGGVQAGIMPVTAPSGWHIVGRTNVKLFDPEAADPVLLRPGDTIRFIVAGIAA